MKQKYNILDESLKPRKLIFYLVWPIILEEFMSILVNYVDTAMVGRCGVNATASVSVCMPFILFTIFIAAGLTSGFGIIMSRQIGEGKKDLALKTMQQGMVFAFIVGIVLTLAYVLFICRQLPHWMNAQPDIWESSTEYLYWYGFSIVFMLMNFACGAILRGQGNTMAPMLGNITRNIVNTVLNFFFIFETRTVNWFGAEFTMPGFGFGVAGAAMATSIATVAGFLVAFFPIFSEHLSVPFRFSFKDFRFERKLFSESMHISLPITAEKAASSLGMIVTTRFLAGVSNQVVAANNLANSGESICFMSVMGFGTAASTLVAQWLGAGNKKRASLLGRECIKYTIIVMACAATVLFFAAPLIIDFFTDDPEVIRMAALALRIQCAVEILEGMAMTAEGILRGAGDAKFPSMVSLFSMWLCRIPLAYFCIKFLDWGLLGLWVPMAVDWVIRFLLIWFRYKKSELFGEKPALFKQS